MDMDSNSFSKQAHMIKEHVGCFCIEEESGVEEDSMDHQISMKRVEKMIWIVNQENIFFVPRKC